MKFIYLSLIIGILSLSLATMSVSSDSDNSISSDRSQSLTDLKRLAASNPETDFAAARAAGDLRFLAMRGYALIVPGVPDYAHKYSKVVGVNVIRGTTDAITSDEQRRLQDAVQRYAERYNKLVLHHLATHR